MKFSKIFDATTYDVYSETLILHDVIVLQTLDESVQRGAKFRMVNVIVDLKNFKVRFEFYSSKESVDNNIRYHTIERDLEI
jgi:hypothetical protein